jgi:hypothetical protein
VVGWDGANIATVRHAVEEVVVRRLRLMSEMDFYPFLAEEDEGGEEVVMKAARARLVLRHYNGEEADLRDCLADLMHYATESGLDFEDELDVARRNFSAEVAR